MKNILLVLGAMCVLLCQNLYAEERYPETIILIIPVKDINPIGQAEHPLMSLRSGPMGLMSLNVSGMLFFVGFVERHEERIGHAFCRDVA